MAFQLIETEESDKRMITIIPSIWIKNNEEMEFFWPKRKADIKKLIKSRVDPREAQKLGWTTMKASRIFAATYATYEDARKKEKSLELFSDTEDQMENEKKRDERLNVSSKHQLEDLFKENLETNKRRAKGQNKRETKKSKREELNVNEHDNEDEDEDQNSTVQEKSNDENSNFGNNEEDPLEDESNKNRQNEHDEYEEVYDNEVPINVYLENKFEEMKADLKEYIQRENAKQLVEIQKVLQEGLKEANYNNGYSDDEDFSNMFPLKSNDEFEDFLTAIKDKLYRKKMVKYLDNFTGGKNLRHRIVNLLRHLVALEVRVSYVPFTSSSTKKVLKDTHFIQLLHETFKSEKIDEIDTNLSDIWSKAQSDLKLRQHRLELKEALDKANN